MSSTSKLESSAIKRQESSLNEAFESVRSRYVVGIDLGTTNCAVAFVDTHRTKLRVEIFRIEQAVEFDTKQRLDTLPSFHYELVSNEVSSIDTLFQFGDATHRAIVGTLARDRSMQMPGRGIASAKSWLCHSLVDRSGDLLPWHGDDSVDRLSPVEISRRYLEHIRRVWDREHADAPLAEQETIVTLPASFDEVARQLTLNAAKLAGLENVVLIEEPQAAFYAWLDRNQETWMQVLHAGQSILVCDIGGGTTDFTLIRVIESSVAESPQSELLLADSLGADVKTADQSQRVSSSLQRSYGLHRVAVGPHLMLGGDNLDLALSRAVEQKLMDQSEKKERLAPRQWDALKSNARAAKEALLSSNPPRHYTLSLPGFSSKLIANTKSVDLDCAWVRELLVDGFFGQVSLNDRPTHLEEGFQEFGLPYESEPNVHRHLAAFLWDHRWDGRDESDRIRLSEEQAARPDWLLFNGGVLESTEIKHAITDQIAKWFRNTSSEEWKPNLLEGNRLDLAVAQGAAYFGLVRRGQGIRIDARLARAFYLLVNDNPPQAMCVMPANAVPMDSHLFDLHPFTLRVGEPVQFPLYYSSTNLIHHAGEVVVVDEKTMTPLPPIQTVIEASRSRQQTSLPVVLESHLSEIGTVQMRVVVDRREDQTLEETKWNLEFDVRAGSGSTNPASRTIESSGTSPGQTLDSQSIERVLHALDSVFGSSPTCAPKQCFDAVAIAAGARRNEWPSSMLREMWRYLIEHQDCRKSSTEIESRWLNLLGWTLRPGFGVAMDDWRVQMTWRSVHNKLIHKSASGASESIILWRRIAGGFTQGQQNALFQDCWNRLKPTLAGSTSSNIAINSNVVTELLRLVGSLEYLKQSDKATVAELAIKAMDKRKMESFRVPLLWMLGRIGSRVPVYATLQQVVSVDRVETWIEQLLKWDIEAASSAGNAYSLAIMLMARKTMDRYRDVSEDLRSRVLDRMIQLKAPDTHQSLVATGGRLDEENETSIVGEALPLGFTLRTR